MTIPKEAESVAATRSAKSTETSALNRSPVTVFNRTLAPARMENFSGIIVSSAAEAVEYRTESGRTEFPTPSPFHS